MPSAPVVSKPRKNRRFMRGCLFVLLAAFGFSAKAVLVKLAYRADPNLDAIALMLLRMMLALPFFLGAGLWSLRRRPDSRRLNGRDWLDVTALGFLGYYLSSLLDFKGLAYISAGLERLILYLYPTFVVLLTAVYRRTAVSRRQTLALLLSYGGILLIYLNGGWQASPENLGLGSAFVAASALSFAVFMMTSAPVIARIGSIRFTAYSMTVACLLTGLHFMIEHGAGFLHLPAQVYILAAIMAVLSTALPSFLMSAGIQQVGADSAAIVSSAGPIGTLILAFLLLAEPLTLTQLTGTLLVLTGVYIAARAK